MKISMMNRIIILMITPMDISMMFDDKFNDEFNDEFNDDFKMISMGIFMMILLLILMMKSIKFPVTISMKFSLLIILNSIIIPG